MRIYNEKLKLYYDVKSSKKPKDEYILQGCITGYLSIENNENIDLCIKIILLSKYIDGYEFVDEDKNDSARDDYEKIDHRKNDKKNINKINKEFNNSLKKLTKLLFKDQKVIDSVNKLKGVKIDECKDQLNNHTKYRNYLKSKEWKKLSKKIKNRDKNKCVVCNKTTNLNCHHITYDNIYQEKEQDLVTLCFDCHNQEHKKINQLNISVDNYYKDKDQTYWEYLKNNK